MSKVPMTVAGETALREELDRLKRVDRPRISDAIAEAREQGDQFIRGGIEEVIFGTTIDLLNTATDELVTYRIVGEDEADVKQNLISVASPVARALIGKEEGDVVLVRTPGGEIEYEIDQVRHV